MKDKYWQEVPYEFKDKWKLIFDSNKDGKDLLNSCPICNAKTMHRYFQINKKIDKIIGDIKYIADGDEWQWCSNCRHYEHMSSLVPYWWKNDLVIDGSKLTAIPEVIEMAYHDPEKVQRWNNVPKQYSEKWKTIFKKNIVSQDLNDVCPICNENSLHQYYQNSKPGKVKYKKVVYKGQGACWQWCGSCFHYTFNHQAYIPNDWICSIEIEQWRLMPIPEPINEKLFI